MSASVNIVVAMKSEALPLIDRFGLERMTSQRDHFSIYGRDHLKLIISGIGADRATEAVRYLSRNGTPSGVSAWLNVGVAGHGSYATGVGFLANCIIDSFTRQRLYPSFIFDLDLPTGRVTTVSEVETEYQEHTGYDMEAFGFAASASAYSTFELIHCFKVVSDNRDNLVQHLTKRDIQNFIASHIDSIDLLCQRLQELAKSVSQRKEPVDPTVDFANRWRMTVAQREILRKYLHRTNILNKEINVNSDVVRNCQNASAMLESIQRHLNQHWNLV